MIYDSIRKVTLAHGAGGRDTLEIIETLFLKRFKKVRFGNGVGLPELDDGASIPLGRGKQLIVTTDSYTVNPIFFPGGNIGKLAATGTINDLVVMGAEPVVALDSIVVEEGFPLDDLIKIIDSIREVLEGENVALIGGDFKVMPKGSIDKIVITMTGIGITDRVLLDSNVRVGDKIIVSGSIGEHGATILALQSGVDVESSNLRSDCQPLTKVMKTALSVGGVHAAKDPTRGGLAMALNEFAKKSNVGIMVWEDKIPIKDEVRMYSEMLGIDPLTVANEGKVDPRNIEVAIVKRGEKARKLTEEERVEILGGILDGLR